jgi:hypothetical protein
MFVSEVNYTVLFVLSTPISPDLQFVPLLSPFARSGGFQPPLLVRLLEAADTESSLEN